MRLLPFLFIFLVTSCLSVPKGASRYQTFCAPSLEKSLNEGIASGAIKRGELPEDQWWNLFNDPQLSTLIERALCCNPTLHEAIARVKIACEEANISRSSLFPTLYFDQKTTWHYFGTDDFFRAYSTSIPANVTEYEINLNLSYEFDFWGKWRNLYRASLGTAYAELAEKAEVELMISSSVAASYILLQVNRQQLELVKQQKETIASLLRLKKLRQEYALDDQQEILAAEEALAISTKQVLLYEQLAAIETHRLLNLIGTGPDEELFLYPIAFNIDQTIPIPENLSCDLLARRPDLMASMWRAKAAAYEVGAAIAEFYPNVNLVALAGFDSVFFNTFFKWKNRTSKVEPAISLPLFTAGAIRSNYREKGALYDEAVAQYNQVLLNAVQQVADQIVSLRTADESLDTQKTIVQNRSDFEKISIKRFENAIGNQLEVLEAKLALTQQKLIELDIHYQRQLSAIQLIKALGGSYHNG